MDNKLDQNDSRWVEDRLAELAPDSDWQPNTVRGLARFQEQRHSKKNRLGRWSWLAAGALAAGVPLMAFSTTREFAHRCVSACVGQSSWAMSFFTGNAPPAVPPSGYIRKEDRKLAPDFVLDDASGQPVKLSDFRGKVVLLNFWATWCIPCAAEIPWFIDFQKEHESDGLVTLGVSLDEDGWKIVKPYIGTHQINYRVMLGNDDVAQLYNATSLPTTMIIDRSGRIAATHVGICGKKDYEADIQAALRGQ
jgi:peroxiredoxin